MTKQKDRSELEHLRGENRRLKSENRHLKRVVKQSNRKVAQIEGLISDSEDLKEEIEHAKIAEASGAPICIECSGTQVNTLVSLPHKTIFFCTDCGKRSSVKK